VQGGRVDYLEKAEKQFKAGKILFEKGYYNDSLSRLYDKTARMLSSLEER